MKYHCFKPINKKKTKVSIIPYKQAERLLAYSLKHGKIVEREDDNYAINRRYCWTSQCRKIHTV